MYLKANPIVGIDLFVEYPMDYQQLYKNSEIKELGQSNVRICSIEDLVQRKK